MEGPCEETEYLLEGRMRSQAPEIDGRLLITDTGDRRCSGRATSSGCGSTRRSTTTWPEPSISPNCAIREPPAAEGAARGAGIILGIWARWSPSRSSPGVGVAMSLPVVELEPLDGRGPRSAARPLGRRLVPQRGRGRVPYDPAGPENNVGFYPLYPLALRGISRILPVNILWTGIGFSLACLLAALLLAGDLFAEWGGQREPGGGGCGAIRGTAALLLYPTSFYFASVYTESLFLLLTVAAFWGSRRGRWAVAGGAGFLASLTRLNGFLVAIPIAWYGWRAFSMSRRKREGVRGGRAFAPAAAVAATLAGAAVFPAYLGARFGDPLLYVHSKAVGWGMRSGSLWTLFTRIVADARDALHDPARLETLSFLSQLASAVLFVGLTVRLFRRGLAAEALYAAASLLLLLHASTVAGMDRYVLALFPAFFVLAADLARRPALAFACMLFGGTLQVTFLHRFVHWIMVS